MSKWNIYLMASSTFNTQHVNCLPMHKHLVCHNRQCILFVQQQTKYNTENRNTTYCTSLKCRLTNNESSQVILELVLYSNLSSIGCHTRYFNSASRCMHAHTHITKQACSYLTHSFIQQLTGSHVNEVIIVHNNNIEK